MTENEQKTRKSRWSAKKQRFLEGLLAGRSVAAAGEQAGCSYSTARRWSRESQVMERLEATLEESMDRLTRRIIEQSLLAADTLQRAMSGSRIVAGALSVEVVSDVGPSVQVGAAKAAIEFSLRARELLLLEGRLARLEQLFAVEEGSADETN